MTQKKRVFIAEDDEIALISLKNLLELSGFEVTPCSNPKEAMSLIKSSKPDVILLDLLMPHLGGFEICDILNKDPQTQGIPVIIISALASEEDIKRAYHLGVISYFTKPYDFPKLLHEINKAIAFKEGAGNQS